VNVAPYGNGGLLLTGNLYGAAKIDFGCGPISAPKGAGGMYVARLDACRSCVWTRAVDGATPAQITAGAGTVVVVGSFTSSADFGNGSVISSPGTAGFVANFSSGDGTFQWASVFGGLDASSTSSLEGVAVDGLGNLLVDGTFSGTLDTGVQMLTSGAGSAMFALKITTPHAAVVWSKSFGPNASAHGATTDADGDLVIAGDFFETPIDFGCGTLQGQPTSFFQPVVVALRPDGSCRFSRWFKDDAAGRAYRIATSPAGGFAVTGSTDGAIDFGQGTEPFVGFQGVFVASLDADGSARWGKAFAFAGGSGTAINAAGDVFLSGVAAGPLDLGSGPVSGQPLFVLAFDATGASRWTRTWPEGSLGEIGTLARDDAGRVVFGGGFGGKADFGCGTASTSAEEDTFLVELAP
jgi:hypothetical protein